MGFVKAHVHLLKRAGQGLAIGAGVAAAAYAGLVTFNRLRYGKGSCARHGDDSRLLDRFMPAPEVIEHHRIHIAAPADVVLATAKSMAVLDSRLIRAIFKAREVALRAQPDTRPHPRALLEQMQSIGWVVLAERANREIVLGSVTRPWEPEPEFRSVPAAEYLEFSEPGYVKILWTLRAEPLGDGESMFHTETRVATTDAEARAKFRTYWSFVAPGVELIRLAMLRPLKKAAERRAAKAA
jgi:hypothetical protein